MNVQNSLFGLALLFFLMLNILVNLIDSDIELRRKHVWYGLFGELIDDQFRGIYLNIAELFESCQMDLVVHLRNSINLNISMLKIMSSK